jgi:hypothetical protein
MDTKINKVSLIFCSAALVFAAAGCVGSADPIEPTPTASTPTATASSSPPTTSPSPSIKPTPKPIPASSTGPAKNWPVPVMPDAATKKTEAGIKAFTEHYYELLEYTITTNESKNLRKITDPSCDACFKEFIDTADGNKVAGSWITGINLRPVVGTAVIDDNNGVALITLTQDEMLVYASDGTQYAKFPAVKNPVKGTILLHFENGWKVQSMDVEAE